MRLHCYACGETHVFTGLEAEMIVYSLQANLADAQYCLEDERPQTPADAFDAIFCLKDALGAAYDVESYSEYVQQQIGCRRAHTKLAPLTREEEAAEELERR